MVQDFQDCRDPQVLLETWVLQVPQGIQGLKVLLVRWAVRDLLVYREIMEPQGQLDRPAILVRQGSQDPLDFQALTAQQVLLVL